MLKIKINGFKISSLRVKIRWIYKSAVGGFTVRKRFDFIKLKAYSTCLKKATSVKEYDVDYWDT